MLGAVPWATVIDKAPHLINEGTKLLGSLRGKKAASPASPATNDIGRLAQVTQAQAEELATLRADLARTTELVVELSRSQAALIGQMRRLRTWCICAGGAAALALAGLAVVAVR